MLLKTPIQRLAFVLALMFLPMHSFAQISQVIGMDTTQSLGNFDHIYGLTSLPNGNLWLSGRCERTLTTSGGQVSNYGTLIQLSPQGNILTSQKSGFRTIRSLTTASDGNMLIGGEGSGFFCTSGLCKSDMLVAKVSPAYQVLWGRSFGNPNYNGSDGLKQVFETADSNVVVVGNIYQSSNNSHPFIAKLNGSTGDTLWTRALGYPSNQFGNTACEGPGGELFLGVSGDLRVSKLNASGQLVWSVGLAAYGQVQRVIALPDGSVLAAGQYMSPNGNYDACLFRLSDTGTVLWFRYYNTTAPDHYEFINDMMIMNGSIYLGGYHYSNSSFTGMYPMMIKTDSAGVFNWARSYPSPVGEVNAIYAYQGAVLCGIDYHPGLNNNRPDILLTTIDPGNGIGNSCFAYHSISTAPTTVNPVSNLSWYYTDYETQPTVIAFSYQNFWDSPACVSTGSEEVPEPNPAFSCHIENGILQAIPSHGQDFTLELFDITGRLLTAKENCKGQQALDVSRYAQQVILVRAGSFRQRIVIP